MISRLVRTTHLSTGSRRSKIRRLFFPFLGLIPEKLLEDIFSIVIAEVEGESMFPTLSNGDRVAIKLSGDELSGSELVELNHAVVLIERDGLPGIYLIKRIKEIDQDLIWIEGDNKDKKLKPLQNDSQKFGWLHKSVIKGQAL